MYIEHHNMRIAHFLTSLLLLWIMNWCKLLQINFAGEERTNKSTMSSRTYESVRLLHLSKLRRLCNIQVENTHLLRTSHNSNENVELDIWTVKNLHTKFGNITKQLKTLNGRFLLAFVLRNGTVIRIFRKQNLTHDRVQYHSKYTVAMLWIFRQ